MIGEQTWPSYQPHISILIGTHIDRRLVLPFGRGADFVDSWRRFHCEETMWHGGTDRLIVEFDGRLEHRAPDRSEEHTSELQSRLHLVCRLLLEKKKKKE